MTFIDLSAVPPCCANHGLDALHKAIAEGASEPAIWRPHENPWLTDLVEHWHHEQAALVRDTQAALFGALGLAAPVALLRKALSADEVDALKARLAKPMHEYTPADWVAFVDLLFDTRLSGPSLERAADDLASKAALAGQLQTIAEARPASAPRRPFGPGVMRRIVTGAAGLPPVRAISTAARTAMDWARARIGLNLRGLTDAGRNRVAGSILGHVAQHGLARPRLLEQTLLDDFGALNRDWRRVAVTEAGEVANSAYLGQFADGARMKRLEAYEGACPFCRRINGLVLTWSTSPRPDTDGWSHVWPGKTNVGRAAAPRKQTQHGLVDRDESELWWPAAGVQHPNCRGRWTVLSDTAPPPGADPAFIEWLHREFPL
jgi:hypothetical protein